MEVPGGLQNKGYICLNEIFGTAFLLIAINWGQNIIVISLALKSLIVIAGATGGANFNPAVSIGILIKEREQKGEKLIFFFQIIASQIFGAFLGAFISLVGVQTSLDDSISIFAKPAMLYPQQLLIITPKLSDGSILFQTALVEIFCTFMFVNHVIQIIKHNGDQSDHQVNSIAVGMGLLMALLLSAGISGGCLNPAVGIVQILFQVYYFSYLGFAVPEKYGKRTNFLTLSTSFEIGLYLVYIFAPLLGGAFAGLYQRYLNEKILLQSEKTRPSVHKLEQLKKYESIQIDGE